MQSAVVFTALLALATAAVLPQQTKPYGQNDLIPDHEYYGGNGHNYVDAQAHEERASIGNSFDAVVNVLRQYKNDLVNANEFGNVENTIYVPDTVNVGNSSDTYMTNVRVTGLKNFRSQNLTMSWEEDAVYAKISWEKLTVNGVYHFINPTGRHSGSFEIVLVDPVYAGNTTLTKNANVYATMSPASYVTFKKAVIDHTALPTVFQDEKPQFDYFVKNVVCQYVATAVANSLYNDIVMNIRYAVRPYLTYQTGEIVAENTDAAAAMDGKLTNGYGFQLKNVRVDNAKNTMAKVHYVRAVNAGQTDAAELRLRMWNVTGECDCAVTAAADGKSYAGKLTFAFQTVRVQPAVDFDGKTAHTRVTVAGAPRVAPKADDAGGAGLAAVWADAGDQLTARLVEYFQRSLAQVTSKSIQNVM